ncbi:MAG: homoserine dehydrogenase [Bacillota bacterium]
MSKSIVKLGVIGFGTVGVGVYNLLEENRREIMQKLGAELVISKIAVRDIGKPRSINIPPGLLTENVNSILQDPAIDIVVEVMGGIDRAKPIVLEALSRGKSVVTANKDLLAEHGKELFDTAREHGANIFFEASVGGGIPIIRSLKESLAANKITKLIGIVNGTTNFILTKMMREGADLADALNLAQALGYAETDPTSDIEGLDAARKLSILASISFNTRVTFKDVYSQGITDISAHDITYAKELGYVVKLLAIAVTTGSELEVRVHPAFLPKEHPLASVNDVFNAIFVTGNYVGETMFYGRGAGAKPTASAVVSDVMAAAKSVIQGDCSLNPCTCFEGKRIKPISEVESRFYLRMLVKDRPGVLAGIASVFGNQGVSLAIVLQKRSVGEFAEIVLITHKVLEAHFQDALCIIEGLSSVVEISNIIRVEEAD